LVSASDSVYQHWQIEFLWESFKESGQTGNFLALIAKDSENLKNNFSCPLLETTTYSPHPLTKDDYSPFNKPASIIQWLSKENSYEGSILLIDPDCIFVNPIIRKPESRKTFCDGASYLDPNSQVGSYLIKRFCRRNSSMVAPALIPVFILMEDLADISARWLEVTEQIRFDKESKQKAGWVAEMWGYSIACAERGIVQEIDNMSCYPNDEELKSIIHYCYDSNSSNGVWGKRKYNPWRNTGFDEEGAKNSAKILNQKLNCFAKKKSFVKCIF
jgi:hypothetical protein